MKYSELLDNVQKTAYALTKRDFKKGDSFLVMASNHIEFLIAALGVWKAGGIVACLTLNLFPSKRIFVEFVTNKISIKLYLPT